MGHPVQGDDNDRLTCRLRGRLQEHLLHRSRAGLTYKRQVAEFNLQQ